MRRILVFLTIMAAAGPALAETRVEIHYAPTENLEHIDIALIGRATKTVDFTAYALTDWAIMQALEDAAHRGVKVRIVFDGFQNDRNEPSSQLLRLLGTPGVEDRIKQTRSDTILHLKAYAIDGRTLRTGSANFSPSGLKRQDNDLVVIEDEVVAQQFETDFERVWGAAHP